MSAYTTQLQAGTGMIEETDSLLSIWDSGMTVKDLSRAALDEGIFPGMSARRVRNVVAECFAPRYLVQDASPARCIKLLRPKLDRAEFSQLLFIYTCRANVILGDFVRKVFWGIYAAGRSEIHRQDATEFVIQANQNGLTARLWSESTIKRVSSYLISCCADFGLIEDSKRPCRKIFSCSLLRNVAFYLSHEMHFVLGKGDNSIVASPDWQLFGMEASDVIEQFRQQMKDGHLMVQAAGGIINIGWKHNNMQEVIDAIG